MYLQSSDPREKSAVCRLVLTLFTKMRIWTMETHCKTSYSIKHRPLKPILPSESQGSSGRTCRISATASWIRRSPAQRIILLRLFQGVCKVSGRSWWSLYYNISWYPMRYIYIMYIHFEREREILGYTIIYHYTWWYILVDQVMVARW